ncbi:uncharacterized protein N7500_008174 [Penicillium coprophilum]|uniref:uncharacterized protein n=1 Tax=Penicillium coprophilum TaxID=36646 RepID=UPI0023851FF1|nr:uncharacterized protein N7500_008174 [Penicillium coprophilum]KAJ5158523.1 hypothetical protein N7500_008174 [Penicillium coprophilum]
MAMDSSSLQVSDELAHIVWASHILSFFNSNTITAPEEPLQSDQEINDDDAADFDNDLNRDLESIDAGLLTASSEALGRKFLDCVCELLAHAKGGSFVTAAALREKEDEVEVDIAQNNGLDAEDRTYLDLLELFLALQADGISPQVLAESSHDFLERTIAYSAERVDSQAEAVVKLLKESPYRSSQQWQSGEHTANTCFLSCCPAAQEPVSTKTQALLLEFLNFDLWRSASSTAQDRDNQRRRIVELAATTTQPPQTARAAREALERMVPSVDPRKIIQMWRVLARPITSLQILSQIARLLPNFRAVSFILLSPPSSFKLQNRQIPSISQAWKHLGLSSSSEGRILPAQICKNHVFKKKCRRNLFIHCEIQLLTRYEAQPSLRPTLDYFGCSKKTCYLCESFLALSSLNFRTRGRHGKCHPQWAVHSNDTESIRHRLKSLCEMIKQKIKARLQPHQSPPPVTIDQSSAVSVLKTLDLLEITRQKKNREIADKKGQELREQMQILLNPRSVGPPEVWYWDLRTLCVMCQASYTRLSKDHRLGIWFPKDTNQPELIWAPIFSPESGFHYPNFDRYIGPEYPMLWTIPFAANTRRGVELDHFLTIYYCDWDQLTNKSVRTAVEVCQGMTVPHDVEGHYVVMSGQRGSYTGTPNHTFSDMSLADFRHALDWFSTYFDTTLRETPSGSSVLAVKISHPMEETLHGRELFTSVDVSCNFPSTSDVSPISQVLGLPLRVCQLDYDDLERATNLVDGVIEKSWTNRFARVLMTDIDLESDNWGKTRRGLDLDGSVLLLREDQADLNLTLAKRLICYCLDVLKPLFERAILGEISRQDVLDEITSEKFSVWKPTDASTDVGVEPRPARGFVRRIGSIRREYEK